ncbi:uncharacterized protein LOC125480223 [Pyrus x bretschneideri]|uniref:uncharacterized protein LOC125480223 n=1 Tax=Pyrus x bretschneideri TaxID=225117 RepID=UPI00202F318A|nr:uncharacterized protein LOC125480223 [Pyrus x bretschneideri]
MVKTKSNKKAAHATPSDDKTLQAVQATQATPSDDKTLQAVQAATQATPSDDKTLQVVQATPSDNKTLEEIMRTRPWEGNQPAVTCRAILRGLIKRVAQLEEAGISCGVLDASQIIYKGSKVTIRNEPTRNEPRQGRFREQIKIWVSKIFQAPAALHNKIEYRDFLKEIHNAGDNFKQLESHPFLLSNEGKANFLLEKIVKLNIEHKGWKLNYRKNPVKIYDKIGQLKGYSDVFHSPDYYYEENALGALLYSRNVVAHIGEYFGRNEKPSKEEVGKRLSVFFPKMMLDFYKFVVNKGTDTRSEPKSVNLVD